MGKTHRYHKIEKPSEDKMTISQYDVYKSTRKDWGNVDPRTKVKKSDKIYKRTKAKQKWQKDIREYL